MLSKRSGLRYSALVAGAALALTACSGDGGDGGADSADDKVTKGGTLKILGSGDNPTVDTADAYDTNSYAVLRTISRQLYSNPSGNSVEDRIENVPDLADGQPELSNGDKTYTIKIKQGVKWNVPGGGRQITAQDAVRGFQFTCNPTIPFGSVGYYTDTIVGMAEFCGKAPDPDTGDKGSGFSAVSQTDAAAQKAYVEANQVAGIKAVDDSTLQIDLKAPTPDFIHLLTLPTVSPRPVEMLANVVGSPASKQNIVESGPYQIETYVPDKSYVLTRNPAWDGKTDTLRQANVDRIEITLGIQFESIQQQIQAGTADMGLGNTPVPPAALSQLVATNDAGLKLTPTGGQNPYMVINMVSKKAALKKLEVRQALNYALNKRNVVQAVGGPKVGLVTGQIFSEGVVGEGFEKQDLYAANDYAGDPEKAKELLAKAGESNLSLIMAYRTDGNGPKIATTIIEDMKKAGITIVPKAVPNRDFYGKFLGKTAITKAGGWDVALPGWGPDWEGTSERSFFTPLLDGRKYGEQSTNWGGYNNDAVNAAADKALVAATQEDSAEQWNAIDKMVMEDAPWVPIYNTIQANYVSKRVKNFQYAFGPSNGDYTNVAVQ